MKIKVLQENLNKSLGLLQKAIPSKPPLPILSSIKLVVKKNSCSVSATDLYFAVNSSFQADVEEEGEVVIPGKQLREIIGSLSAGALTLDYQDGTLVIKSPNSSFKLQCLNSEEYPPFPEVTGQSHTLTAGEVEQFNQLVAFSASSDVARPVLTAALIRSHSDLIEMVCTDGFRLSMLKLARKNAGEPELQVLLPAKSLAEVWRIMTQVGVDETRLVVSSELKQIMFEVGQNQVFVRLIEGEYPPYEKIVPSTFTTEIKIDAKELEENIKRALVFVRDSSSIVKIVISDKGKVGVLSSSSSLGNYEGKIEQVQVKGIGGEIAFNARYLLDFISAVKSETIWFGMSESLKPAMCKSEDYQGYQYVVMPFRVND